MTIPDSQYDTYGYITTGGSANAYTIQTAESITGYSQGLWIRAKASFSNTAAATLNVNGIGAASLKKAGGGSNVASGDIVNGGLYDFVHDGTNFQVLQFNASVPSAAPVGASYVTLGLDSTLTAERVLTAGTGISLTDGGANSTITVAGVAFTGDSGLGGTRGDVPAPSAGYAAAGKVLDAAGNWTNRALVFVQEFSLSSASSCEITVPSDAKELIIEIDDLAVSGNANLFLTYSSGGSYLSANYTYEMSLGLSSTTASLSGVSQAQITLLQNATSTYSHLAGTIKIRQPNSSSLVKHMNAQLGGLTTAPNYYAYNIWGYNSGTAALDKVKIVPSAGTFTGLVRVYKQIGS